KYTGPSMMIKRVGSAFKEFLLEPQTFRFRLCRSNCLCQLIDKIFGIELSQLLVCIGTLAGVVVRKACVPPDSRVERFRQMQTFQVFAGLRLGAVQMNKFRMRDQ